MRCSTCSELLPDEARFCGACGNPVRAPATSAPILLTQKKKEDPIPLTHRKPEPKLAETANAGRRNYAAQPAEQQRQSPRAKLEVDVTFESEHNFYTGFLE